MKIFNLKNRDTYSLDSFLKELKMELPNSTVVFLKLTDFQEKKKMIFSHLSS